MKVNEKTQPFGEFLTQGELPQTPYTIRYCGWQCLRCGNIYTITIKTPSICQCKSKDFTPVYTQTEYDEFITIEETEQLTQHIERCGRTIQIVKDGIKKEVATLPKKIGAETLKFMAGHLNLNGISAEEINKAMGKIASQYKVLEESEKTIVQKVSIDDLHLYVGEFVCFEGFINSVEEGKEEINLGEGGSQVVCSTYLTISKANKNDSTPTEVKLLYSGLQQPKPFGLVQVYGTVGLPKHFANKVKTNPLQPSSLMVIASTVKPSKFGFRTFQATPQQEQDFKQYFGKINNENFKETIDGYIAPHIVQRENIKLAQALTFFAPLYTPLKEDEYFTINHLSCGDTTEGKDRIANDLIEELSPAGAVSVNAERTSVVGLLGGCEKVHNRAGMRINWGKFTQADGAVLHLSGMSGFDGYAWSSVRETITQGKVKIDKIVKGEAIARFRMLGTANCRKPISHYRSKYHSLLDIGSLNNLLLQDLADFRRIHLFSVFAGNDVSNETVFNASNKENKKERTIPIEVMQAKTADAWRRGLDINRFYDIESVLNVQPLIKKQLKTWENAFTGCKEFVLPIFRKEGNKIFTALVMSCACWKHRVNQENKIVIEKEDVEFVADFHETWFRELGLRVEVKAREELKTSSKEIAKWLIEQAPEHTKVSDYLLLLKTIYGDTSNPTIDKLTEKLDCGRRTLFSLKSEISKDIEKQGFSKEELIEGKENTGQRLTELGVMVVREVERLQELYAKKFKEKEKDTNVSE